MKRFFCPTAIVTGPAAQALAQLKPARLMLVADPYFVKTGVAQCLLQGSGAQQTLLFSDISPDPSVELAAQGTAALKKFQPDTVAALGGGSAIDCAKAMVFFSGLRIKFAAIPTTSGSGSEVTDFSILTHNGVKHPLVDDSLRPDVAILDEAFLQKLPPSLIADTGFFQGGGKRQMLAQTDQGVFQVFESQRFRCSGNAGISRQIGVFSACGRGIMRYHRRQ